MLFFSPEFFLFFALYLGVHAAVPLRHRLWVTLLGGTLFYAWWNPWLMWLPHLLAIIGWGGAMVMARQTDARRRRLLFALFTVLMFTPLAVFKYAGFLYQGVVQPLFGLPDASLSIPLPLGISFVSFTMMAYMADTFSGRYPLERRLGMVSASMVFFPHLIAGPILRPREIIPQLERPRRLRDANLLLAGAVFSVGLLKKLFFADQIALHVEKVYSATAPLTALDYLAAIWGFSFQIYGDFSGYTDMAIGLAMIIGVRLPGNFRTPYASASIVEFWRRWHITLSHWLRDYLYIPLGGNRGGAAARTRNILVTMLLGGLWHGANWTFVLWGGMHGAAIIVTHAWHRSGLGGRLPAPIGRPWHWVKVALTFNLVSWLWVLFRAPDLAAAARVAAGPWAAPPGDPGEFLANNGFLILLIGLSAVLHRMDTHSRIRCLCRLVRRHNQHAVAWVAMGLVWVLVIGINTGSSAKFIYFDF
jgi:alginate O-acetyltransferase complex protein AlgI